MPRLLLLFEYPTLHGGEHSLLTCLLIVRKAGFEILALAPGESPLASALSAHEIEVHRNEPRHAEGASQAQRRELLADAMGRLRPDLVHANSLSMSRLAGPVAAELGVPSLGHLRDIVSLSRQAAADINRHNRLLAVSQATRQWHIGQGLKADKIHVCHNGVDLQLFQPRDPSGFLHRELKLPAQAALVGSIGQVVMRKGLDVTMKAMESVLPAWPDVHWVIVGERFSQKAEAFDYERRLRAAALAFAGRIHFLGVRNDVNRILNELVLLVHAARQEPLGRVILEAAASGLPFVATDVGGTSEITPCVEFSELLIPPDDPSCLAAAMGRLLTDSALRERTSAQLRRRASDVFEGSAAAGRLLEHYRIVARET